jgi:molybdopterin molybdotransferase
LQETLVVSSSQGTKIEVALPSFEEARSIVVDYAAGLRPSGPEMMSLLDGAGLVLAEDLRADRDFPPFPRSTRDGFAVRAHDVGAVPARLRCVGEIRAGVSAEQSGIALGKGDCVEIMTGAPVPAGSDAVVMVEHTEREGKVILVRRPIAAGENIVAAGAEANRGDVMVPRGTRVNHAVTAVAAAIGRAEVAVHRRPRVAILATGDELVDINLPPGPSEIRNSNSYSLAAQVLAAGGEPVILPVARDEADEIALLLRKGLEADLLLITGGVSMGKYDLVEQVLASFEAKLFFTGARIQPGRPVVFGEVASSEGTTPFFGLPGNPVSTMVTFQLFARVVLDALAGAQPQPLPFAQAMLKSELKTKTGLTRFLPARLGGTHPRPEVEVIRWQGSGDLMSTARANCYIVVPLDRERFAAGEAMTILMM